MLGAMIVALIEAKQLQPALILWLMFETYMRPSEALALTRMQVIERTPLRRGRRGSWR